MMAYSCTSFFYMLTSETSFFFFFFQISGTMKLGLDRVCRPVRWPFGSVLDSRHCVFALTLLTLLMQVVVEANSWWYAFIFSSICTVFLCLA